MNTNKSMIQRGHDSQWREDSRAGLAAAFAAFYQQSREHIYFYLRCFRLPQPQAQELTQEAFVILWQALQEEVKIENHRAWLFGVARHLALKSKAYDGHFPPLDDEIVRTLPTHDADPEQGVMERERLLRILAAIGKLSP